METMQTLIHKLELGEGARWVRVLTVMLLIAGMAAIYDLRELRNLSAPEAMDAAQLARNLSRGEGFTTSYIRPLSLHLLDQKAMKASGGDVPLGGLQLPHPDLANPPVYPLLLAGFLKVVPTDYKLPEGQVFMFFQPDVLIAAFNQLLLLILAGLTFLLGRELFDATVGRLAVVALLGSELIWQFSASGLSTVLLMVWVTALALCLVKLDAGLREQEKGAGWTAILAGLSGLLVGLACLTRYGVGILVVPVIGYLAWALPKRRLLASVIALAVFLAVLAPWVARNVSVSGTWFGVASYAMFQNTSSFPGHSIMQTLEPEPTAALVRECARKIMWHGPAILINELPRLAGTLVSAFFIAGLVIPYLRPVRGRIRFFLLGSLVFLGIIQALSRSEFGEAEKMMSADNILIAMGPLVIVFGAALFSLLMDQVEWPIEGGRILAIAGYVLVMIAPFVLALMPPRPDPRMHPPYYPPVIQQAADWMQPSELIMSDIPWAVAWYGDRTCLWTTLYARASDGKEDIYAINDFREAISLLYLSPVTVNGPFMTTMFGNQALTRVEQALAEMRGEDPSELEARRNISWGEFTMECLARTNLPAGFPMMHAHGSYAARGHFLLSDQARWRRPISRLPGEEKTSQ